MTNDQNHDHDPDDIAEAADFLRSRTARLDNAPTLELLTAIAAIKLTYGR